MTGGTAAAADSWYRAESRHFVIYSDGDSRTLEDFATRAERFDTLFRYYFALDDDADPVPLTIYLLKDASDVAEVAHDENGLLAGFYRADREGSFAVSNRKRTRSETGMSGQVVLFHEYVHHLMAHHFTYAYPTWYREGFAEYFATATIDNDGNWTLGEPANHRAISLRNVNIPLERVLFGGTEGLNGPGTDAYYGRSWLMVHMFANDAELTQKQNTYLAQLGTGADPQEAFAAIFGDIEDLDSDLDRYLRGRLYSKESVEPIAVSGAVQITELDEASSALADLEMRRRIGKETRQTRDSLLALASRLPARADVLAQLALAERDLANEADLPNYAAALRAADAALALAPDHARMNVLKANLMMAGDAADMEIVRRHIGAARAAAPNSPLPLLADYDSYSRESQLPPVEVVNGLMRAFKMVPEAHDVRVTLAYALLNEGLSDNAIKLVEFLAADPHAGSYGKRVLEDLQRHAAP